MALIGEQPPHAISEIGRERELAAIIGGNLRLGRVDPGDDGVGLAQSFEPEHFAGEHEAVAGHKLLDEILLHLAEHATRGKER